MKTSPTTPPAAHGFTLIELLVVIAIIAVLASLLLSALTSAKRKGQSLVTLNNLRQLTLGWVMYADDYQGHLPPNTGAGKDTGKVADYPSWVGGWLDLSPPDPHGNLDNIDTSLLIGGAHRPFTGLLGPFVSDNAGVFRSPGDRSKGKVFNREWNRVRSVSMNGYMNGKQYYGAPHFISQSLELFLKLESIKVPAKKFVFIEEREDSINEGAFWLDANSEKHPGIGLVDYPASYWNGVGVLSFADGHVETKKWQDDRTKPMLKQEEYLALGKR